MAKAKTPSYVLTLELKVNSREAFAIEKNFRIGKQIYNDCLGEALKRLHRMQSDKEYSTLRKELTEISKRLGDKRKEDARYKEICDRLNVISVAYGFTESAVQHYGITPREHFHNALSSNEVQVLASRAFAAVDKIRLGKATKVRFKSQTDYMSIENKCNDFGLRYKDGYIIWGKLKLAPIVKAKDQYAQFALQDKTKYVRTLKKEIRGKFRYFVQLVQEETPPNKNSFKSTNKKKPAKGDVGLDIGPSTVAIVSDKIVSLRELAPGTEADARKIRILQRKLDRSRRATNPNNYNKDGTLKRGKRTWVELNHYKKNKQKLKEMQRKSAAKRYQSHNILANEIILLGSKIYVENMNFKGLQKRSKKTTINKKNGKINKKKRFGKSIANHSPGLLIEIIDRKLSYSGNKLYKIDTKSAKASQYNHITDTYTKKDLNERWTLIGDNLVQRDLYSAFLIKNIKANLQSVNRRKCIKGFDKFLKLHNREVKNIKKSQSKAIKNVI